MHSWVRVRGDAITRLQSTKLSSLPSSDLFANRAHTQVSNSILSVQQNTTVRVCRYIDNQLFKSGGTAGDLWKYVISFSLFVRSPTVQRTVEPLTPSAPSLSEYSATATRIIATPSRTPSPPAWMDACAALSFEGERSWGNPICIQSRMALDVASFCSGTCRRTGLLDIDRVVWQQSVFTGRAGNVTLERISHKFLRPT